jgi:hypothetical protein
MSSNAETRWRMTGTALIACNCDYGCPCNFNALPSKGKCEGGWVWLVDEGVFGDVSLDKLSFALFVKWPGAIHHGHGEGVLLVDAGADARQEAAITTLVKGGEGGPWGVLGWTWPTLHGPKRVPFDIRIDGIHSRVKAGDAFIVESTTIKNPVTGAEAHPSALLPEGLIVKRADLGCSAVFRVDDAIVLDHSGQYTGVGRFDYGGP